MKKHLLLTIIVYSIFLPLRQAFAQEAKEGRQALEHIVQAMHKLSVYSYEMDMQALFPNGQKDRMTTALYMDKGKKRLMTKSKDQVIIVSGGWIYKADHDLKEIAVMDMKKYDRKIKDFLPEVEELFNSDAAPAQAWTDSLLLNKGRIRTYKQEGGKQSFVVVFPNSSYLQEMEMVYNNATNLPEKIKVKSFVAQGASPGTGTLYEISCTNYKSQVPDHLFNLQQYFVIKGGKVLLQQYKNYKVTSLL